MNPHRVPSDVAGLDRLPDGSLVLNAREEAQMAAARARHGGAADPFAALVAALETLNAQDVRLTARAPQIFARSMTQAPAAPADAPRFGEWLRDAYQGKIRNAGMSEAVPSGGGFLVPTPLADDFLWSMVQEQAIRPRATVVEMTSLYELAALAENTDRSDGSSVAGIEFSATQEGALLGESTPGFSRVMLEASKIAGYTGEVPNELIQDAAPWLDAWYRKVAQDYGRQEDHLMLFGSGVGEPQGCLASRAAITVPRAASGTVSVADVAALAGQMWPEGNRRYVWVASPGAIDVLRQSYLQLGSPTTGIAAGTAWFGYNPATGRDTLLGRDLFPNEWMADTGTAGDLAAVDAGAYLIGDRRQLSVEIAGQGQGFGSDTSEVRFTSRVDGRPLLTSPVTLANGSATKVSPFVVLGDAA